LKSKVLICGFGYLGQVAGGILCANNYDVFALRRNVDEVPTNFTSIKADLASINKSLGDIPFEYIVYCVAADKYSIDAYNLAYRTGIMNLLASIDTKPVKRIIFISSTSVFAESQGSWVDESSALSTDEFSHALLEGEGISANSGIEYTILRLSGIYGQGRTRRFSDIIDKIRNNLPVYPPQDNYVNAICVSDIARVILHVISKELNGIFVVNDCKPQLKSELINWLTKELQITPNQEPIIQKASSVRFGKNKRCCNNKLLQTGFTFTYPSVQDFILHSLL